MRRHCRLLVLAILIILSCKKETKHPANPPRNILLIGNSYTFSNKGLAHHLKQFAVENVETVTEIAKGGYTLEDHWNDSATVNAIKRGGWDIITLQEHSLRPLMEKEKMFLYAQKLDSLIKSTGKAKLYFFMTWAYKNDPEMIQPLSDSYKEVAKNLKATLIPIGLQWNALKNSKDSINLYDADNQHPNINGTFFTASIFYKVLFNKDPRLNPYLDSLIAPKTGTILKERANTTQAIKY